VEPLPILYLHLETAVLPIFLVMVLLVQLARSTEPGYYTSKGRHQVFWLLAAFGLLALAFSALLANVSPLLAVELAAGFTLSLLHPVNALCFFVYLLFLRPWEIVTTNTLLLSLPRTAGALCVFSWLMHPGQHGKPAGRTYRVLILLLGFSIWLFLTTFQTPNIVESQVDWFSTYFKSLVVFMMCLFFIESEKSVREFGLTLVISALALMVVRLYQYHNEGPGLVRLELGGMFGDPNDLAAIIVMALPFALVPVFKKAAHLGPQVLGILFSGISGLVIWYSQSRGAMLALAVQVLTAGVLKSNGKKWLSALLLGSLLGAGYVAVLKVIPRKPEEMQASSESRITYWKTAVNMTLHHPIFGVGFDQYPENYDAYSFGTKYEWGRRAAHSSWFLAFAESGFPGGILFISFFMTVLKTAWRHRRRWPEQLYAIVGYGVVMSFLSHTYGMYVYLLAGLIMASDAAAERPDDGL
jgi:O-antigen ligase